eukprot:SAG11_NODE_2841_length_2917_cov_2.825701_3_plen_83_part_00
MSEKPKGGVKTITSGGGGGGSEAAPELPYEVVGEKGQSQGDGDTELSIRVLLPVSAASDCPSATSAPSSAFVVSNSSHDTSS